MAFEELQLNEEGQFRWVDDPSGAGRRVNPEFIRAAAVAIHARGGRPMTKKDLDQIPEAKAIMARVVHMPPKSHDKMKIKQQKSQASERAKKEDRRDDARD